MCVPITWEGIRDCGAVMVVPVLLVAVFLLPEETKHALALHYGDPTLRSAITMHFVHVSSGHLFGNVLGYLIVAPVAYSLAVLGRARRAFFVTFVVVLTVFPLVLSGLSLLYTRTAIGFGFSGLLMAFVGLVPVLTIRYFNQHVSSRIDLDWVPIVFLAGSIVVALRTTAATQLGWLTVAATMTATGTYVVLVIWDGPATWPRWTTVRQHLPEVAFGLIALATAGIVFAVGFPADPVGDGTKVNVYLHLVGFGLGAMVTYTTFQLVGVEFDDSMADSVSVRQFARDARTAVRPGSNDRT